jgi:hypothetical protein
MKPSKLKTLLFSCLLTSITVRGIGLIQNYSATNISTYNESLSTYIFYFVLVVLTILAFKENKLSVILLIIAICFILFSKAVKIYLLGLDHAIDLIGGLNILLYISILVCLILYYRILGIKIEKR